MKPLPTLDDCVHCGLCLESCPTYAVTGREAESPRGRIQTLRRFIETSQRPSRRLSEALDTCLICRACETSCPAGISMDGMMSEYRSTPNRGSFRDALERFFLEEIIEHPDRLAQVDRLTRWVAPLLTQLRINFGQPSVQRLRRNRSVALHDVSRPRDTRRTRAYYLRGCVADFWFRDQRSEATELLRGCGVEVVASRSGCCGALHRHAGLIDRSQELSQALWESFSSSGAEWFVVDSAGCAGRFGKLRQFERNKL